MLYLWDDGGKMTESVRMTVDIFCRLFSARVWIEHYAVSMSRNCELAKSEEMKLAVTYSKY